jgi:hypothetical protein
VSAGLTVVFDAMRIPRAARPLYAAEGE